MNLKSPVRAGTLKTAGIVAEPQKETITGQQVLTASSKTGVPLSCWRCESTDVRTCVLELFSVTSSVPSSSLVFTPSASDHELRSIYGSVHHDYCI